MEEIFTTTLHLDGSEYTVLFGFYGSRVLIYSPDLDMYCDMPERLIYESASDKSDADAHAERFDE